VATLLNNGPAAIFTWLGANMLGAICAPINTANRGAFLRHTLNECGASVAVIDREYSDRIEAISGELEFLKTVLLVGDGPAPTASEFACLPFESVRTDRTEDLDGKVLPSDLTLLLFTSGTTGPSKACMLSHNQVCYVGKKYNDSSGRRPDELFWSPLPLFHLAATGLTFAGTILLGGACSIYPRFRASTFWAEVERTGARVVNPVGGMATIIANLPDSPEMRRCKGQIRIAGGAPFPLEIQQIWKERFGVQQVGGSGYGSTEVGVAFSAPSGEANKPGSHGKPTADFDARVVDELDRELPPNEVGELVVRPLKPNIMFEGYWRRPEATAATWRNLWHHTGDLGKFDDDGFFYFVDRKKDYLRRGGENVSSMELEAAFREHPDVLEVAAYGIPSEAGEDDIMVAVVLHEGAEVTEVELVQWSIDRVPRFAVPRYVEFLDALPKNAVDRVLKFELRERGVTQATWDRASAGLSIPR
jgi:crotonobetaine/carnitine-CoA ligase